ncbi:MAG: hypothetical protein WBR26_05200 [Candidatus Acidiferrum sp.]
MRVPLIIHLPDWLRQNVHYDDSRISALIDITPSLYYLLGHRPVTFNPLFGHPLFAFSNAEPRGSVENRPTGVTSKPANGVAQDVILIYPAFS